MSTTDHLTQGRIAELVPRPGARYIVYDGGIPGFGVRVSDGAKTFVLRYRLTGGRGSRGRWATLGRVGLAMALEQAKDRTRDYLGVVARRRAAIG